MNFVSNLRLQEEKGRASQDAGHASPVIGGPDPGEHVWGKRLAEVLANGQLQEDRFRQVIEQGFVPSARLLQSVVPFSEAIMVEGLSYVVGDSISQKDALGYPGISETLKGVAEAWRRGAAVCLDFSQIRPSGSNVRGLGPIAGGPVTYLQVFESLHSAIGKARSTRRSTSASLRVDHPDISSFISTFEARGRSSAADGQVNRDLGFRYTVGITDRFVQAVLEDGDFELKHLQPPATRCEVEAVGDDDFGPYLHRTVRATDLWAQIARAVCEGAAVDVVFIDKVHATNNLRYAEAQHASEEWMPYLIPNNGCIARGCVQLTRFVDQPYTSEAVFNFDSFAQVVQGAVELLDAVHDRTTFPLPEQQAESLAKRRIGLGFLGLFDTMKMLGIEATSEKGVEFARMLAVRMRDEAYHASMQLAVQRGAFPMFSAEHFLDDGTFASTLPRYIRHNIRAFGVRNASVLALEMESSTSSSVSWRALLTAVAPYFEASIFDAPSGRAGREEAELLWALKTGWCAGATGLVLARER